MSPDPHAEALSPAEQAARDEANLRSLLEPDVPAGLAETLQGCRPFTGATLALMQQTGNEWLRRIAPAEMENSYWATLSWLFIQSAPENLVRRVVWEKEAFRNAVLEWGNQQKENGEPRITAEILAAADMIIQATLGLVDQAEVSVQEKPSEGAPETPPPNS